MINKLKRMFKGEKDFFNDICLKNKLALNYDDNKKELSILEAIFNKREYSDYFPFYKKSVIVDIGAHYGYFSIFAHNNSSVDSTIIAIEPNIRNYKQLERNIKNSQINNISVFNHAIGGESGVAKLFQGQNPNHSIIENYHLIKTNSSFDEVQVKTLEELILELDLNKIDFLKMDCEGAEYSIFQKTPKYIFDRITTISLEFHDLKDKNFTADNIVKVLLENDFEIVKFNYENTSMNLNYGKIIGSKMFRSALI